MTPQVQTQEPRGPVVERVVPFTPTKVDLCEDNYIITGSLGELAKLTRDGKLIEEYSIPFPSSITHSTTLGDFWIGIWVEAEMRLARMSSLNVKNSWENGPSRSELRTSSDPMSLHPRNTVWSHALDSEPTCITDIGDDFCFVLRGKGIYRMDKHANEVWRSNLPSTIDGNLRGSETAISISQSDDFLSIWYDNGLVVDISTDTGIEIDRRRLPISDRIERVFHSENFHLLALSEQGFLIANSEEILQSHKTPGPLFAARYRNGQWEFTGWRFDGTLGNYDLKIHSRKQLGIGFVADRVLTNDGTLCDFAITHS